MPVAHWGSAKILGRYNTQKSRTDPSNMKKNTFITRIGLHVESAQKRPTIEKYGRSMAT